MAHKGIREWTSDELSSVALGQNGFHVLTNGAFTIGANAVIENVDSATQAHTGKNDGTYWIAIKAAHNITAVVSARSYGAGDDLSRTGAYDGAQISLGAGDIIYGAFDAITIDSSDYVIAYIGK